MWVRCIVGAPSYIAFGAEQGPLISSGALGGWPTPLNAVSGSRLIVLSGAC